MALYPVNKQIYPAIMEQRNILFPLEKIILHVMLEYPCTQQIAVKMVDFIITSGQIRVSK